MGERETGNLRSDSPGTRGGVEDATEGTTPTSNPQRQPQDSIPQRDRRIMRRTRSQRRKARDRIGEGGGEANKR